MSEGDVTDRGLFDFAGLARSLERVVDDWIAAETRAEHVHRAG